MRRIVCEECRRAYDFDRDDFCPRCGAFNQPVKTWGVDAQGNVIRVDGVNEQNHGESFVHREVHREKAVRRAVGMDWNKGKPPRSGRPSGGSGRAQDTKKQQPVLFWVLMVIIVVNFILPLLAGLIDWLFG